MGVAGYLLVLLAAGVVSGYPSPQSFKLGAGEVGASFGGYSASAGLGGLLGGNGGTAGGLHAEAGTPGGPAAAAGLGGLLSGGGAGGGKLYSGATTGGNGPSASAGLGGLLSGGGAGGGKVYSGATTGTGSYAGGFGGGNYVSGGGVKGGFFDRIFDIPISTLNAVNRFLNEGGSRVTKTGGATVGFRTKVRPHDGHAVIKSKLTTKYVAPPLVAYPAAQGGGGAFASSSTSAASSGVVGGGNQAAGFYDRVFDIPISVLAAVNRLLNGKQVR